MEGKKEEMESIIKIKKEKEKNRSRVPTTPNTLNNKDFIAQELTHTTSDQTCPLPKGILVIMKIGTRHFVLVMVMMMMIRNGDTRQWTWVMDLLPS